MIYKNRNTKREKSKHRPRVRVSRKSGSKNSINKKLKYGKP